MASLEVEGTDLVVRLSDLEKLAAFRSEVRVPLATVSSVVVEPNPWGALRGFRSPGTGFPRVIAYGVRRFRGAQDFTAVLRRRPAVRVELDETAPFRRLVISVASRADAEETVAWIESARSGLPQRSTK